MSDDHVERLKQKLAEMRQASTQVMSDDWHAAQRQEQLKIIDQLREAGYEPFPVDNMSREEAEGEYLQLRAESSQEDDVDRKLAMLTRMTELLGRLDQLGVYTSMPIGWPDKVN